MHAEPKRSERFHVDRVRLAIAAALVAGALAAGAAGVVLGGHADAQGAPRRAASAETAKPLSAAGAFGVGSDPSLPAAAEAFRGSSHDLAEPSSTF